MQINKDLLYFSAWQDEKHISVEQIGAYPRNWRHAAAPDKGVCGMQRRVLITGAAGKTAKVVAEMLAGRGFFVRALVRKEDDRSKRLADRGAEIVTGDMLSLADMKVATHGMDSAYFCYPTSDRILEASAIMTEAARENEMGYRSNSGRALRNSL